MNRFSLTLLVALFVAGSSTAYAESAPTDTNPAFPCKCDAECKQHGMQFCGSWGFCDHTGPGTPCDGGVPTPEQGVPRNQGFEGQRDDFKGLPDFKSHDGMPGPDGMPSPDGGVGLDAKAKSDMDCTKPGANCVFDGESGGCAVTSGAAGLPAGLVALLLLGLFLVRRRR